MNPMTHMFDRSFSRYLRVDRYSLFNSEEHPRDNGGRFALKGDYKPDSASAPPKPSPAKAPIKFGFDARPAGTVSPMDFAIKKQAPSLPGQKSLLAGLDAEFEKHLAAEKLLKQKSLFRRLGPVDRYAKKGEKRWITIGAGEGKKGTHVEIDGKGEITKGPKSLKGANVSNLPSSGAGDTPFSLKKEKAELWYKHQPKPKAQKGLFAEETPAKTEESHPNRPKPRPSDGRIVGPGLGKVNELHIDPNRFQYKLNTDNPAGVTDQFSDIDFNPQLAGTIHVWHDPADGKTYVVNGHHRADLAKRSGYDGDLQLYYIDAQDDIEARAAGAMINIAGGNGTAVDAAKFLRDSGRTLEEMKGAGISVKGAVARDAAILAGLSDNLFQKVTQGDYRMPRALAIARHLQDHDKQNAADRVMSDWEKKKGQDIPEGVANRIAWKISLVPTVKTDKGGLLFEDAMEDERSVIAERSELEDAISRDLSKKLNAFKAVSTDRKADILSEHNSINTQKNRVEAESLSRLIDDFNRESQYRGPVGDLLNAAAVEYANAPKKYNSILRKLREDVLGLIGQKVSSHEPGTVSEGSEIGADGIERHKPAPGQKGFFGRRFWEVKDFYSIIRSAKRM